MRVRLPIGRGALLAAGVAAALVATLPARLAVACLGLDALGFSARDVDGTMWAARASEAQLGGLPLGDVRIALDPLPLLFGRARLALAGDGARGSVTIARHRFGVSGDGWRLALGGRFAPLPVAAIRLDAAHARFSDGLCDAAGGSARLELAGDPFGLGLPATLAGPLRCEGGVLTLDASGGAARVRLSLVDGGVRTALSLRPGDAPAAAKLAAAGFVRAADGGYTMTLTVR